MRVAFSHQFVITKTTYSLPVSWSWRRFGNFQVATAPDLPIVKILDQNGVLIAFLLGWPIDISTQTFLPSDIAIENWQPGAIEKLILTLAGRWLAFDLLKEQVYADAMSSQSAIFHAEQQIVCSSAALLPESLQQLNVDIFQAMNVAKSENFYPFGLLPQPGLKRLLPSHTFSFQTARASRYWWPDPTTWLELPQAASLISSQVAQVISACVRSYPVRQGLSAGLDTRLMLACSKPFHRRIKFWTRAEKKQDSSIDRAVAKALSSRFDLDHELITSETTPTDDETTWLQRTGHCIGGGALKNRHLIDSIQQVYIALTGIGGETCRAFYWPSPHLPKQLNVHMLLKLAGLPELDEFIDAGTLYLEQIRHLPVQVQLGMFYLENRVAAYASPHKYGNENGIIFIYPLNQHDIVNQMLICPQPLQLTSALHRQVIKQSWAELEQLPYNLPLKRLPRIYKLIRQIISRYKHLGYLWHLNRRYQPDQQMFKK